MSSSEGSDYERENRVEEPAEFTAAPTLPVAGFYDVKVENIHSIGELGKFGNTVIKEFNGKSYMGCIISYDPSNQLPLQVLYEDGRTERVTKEEAQHIVAPPNIVEAYMDFIKQGLNIVEGTELCLFMDYYENDVLKSKPKKVDPKPRHKRTKKIRKPSDYVPLAYRERKADLYIWYHK